LSEMDVAVHVMLM